MSKPILHMTEGDNDSFTVRIEGVDLTGADFYRIRMQRPSDTIQVEGIDIGSLSQGLFQIKFGDTDLVAGELQPVDIIYSIGGDKLTSENHLYISVKAAI